MLLCWLLISVFLLQDPAPALNEVDHDTGLIRKPGWELVRDYCTACHSADLITRQRGGRQIWLDAIRWMQAQQGMPALAAKDEKQILDYLSSHYAPTRRYRRAPIPFSLLPPNPYGPVNASSPP